MSKYADAFRNPKGPGDARPTAMQIVEDEGLIGELTDKVFVITGVSSGIGIETMRALYATGGHVFGTARDLKKAESVVDEIQASTKGGSITLVDMHMDDLASIKKGAEDILNQTSKINILVANAGVMATPEGRTMDGFETQLGTNHLGHFYLFQLLKDALLAAATPAFPSRYVSLSSTGHRFSSVRFDDLNFDKGYDSWLAYGQSKSANILMANEIERRYGSQHLHANSLMPGGIDTGLTKHQDPEEWKERVNTPERQAYYSSIPQGAATTIWAALSEDMKGKGGHYLSRCAIQEQMPDDIDHLGVSHDGYAPHAIDEAAEKRLWEVSLKMVGLA